MSEPILNPANPGASSQVVLYDSTGSILFNVPGTLRRRSRFGRLLVAIWVDQPVTFYTRCLVGQDSTTWRVYNNAGAGDTVAANVLFLRDVVLLGEETQLYIATGAVPPTVWEVSVKAREGLGVAF
jgi:hypothetical protein